MITSLLSSWSICCVGGLCWRPLSLLFKSKLPDISFNMFCSGYDLRLRMRRFFIQQAQARRWWIGSLKFAIGLEPPSLRNTAGILLSLEISYGISPWKISVSWSCLLLISGCFLSVTILYHTLSGSSIRKIANVTKKDLYILQIDLCISLWYTGYVGRV